MTMNMKVLRRITYLPLAAMLVAGTLFASPPPKQPTTVIAGAAGWTIQNEASELLREIRSLTVKLDRDAGTLESLARGNQVSWQSHANYLNLAKEHINSMGELLGQLRDIRHGASPWQQRAIERIYPVALELANRTEAAIGHLNENKSRLFDPDYQNHLATIAERAEEMKTSVADFLELGETQEKLGELQEKLERTAS
jgi:hypothetical protein